jgi:hypothetical protein
MTAPHQVQGGGDMKRKLIVGLAAALYAVYGIIVLDALYSPKHEHEQHASAGKGGEQP